MKTTTPPWFPPALRNLLVDWFVRYNPLFTASALCILGGVLGLSDALGSDASVTLTLVLDVYQWMLIGAAALLYRRLFRRRPAVILGLIAVAFMGDPTLQWPALATAGAGWLSLAWLGSFLLKMRALVYAFRLRVSAGVHVVVGMGAAALAMVPIMRVTPSVSGRQVMGPVLALMVFLIGIVARSLELKVESRLALDEDAQGMFRRVFNGVVAIGLGLVGYHAWNAVFSIGFSSLLPALGAVALLGALRVRDEWTMWVLVGAGQFMFASFVNTHVVGMLLAAATLLLASQTRPGRVLTVAVLLVCSAAIKLEAAPTMSVLLFASVALGGVLYRRHAWSAVPALAGLWWPFMQEQGWLTGTVSASSRGALMIAAGFVFLLMGLLLHGVGGSWESTVASDGEKDHVPPSTPAHIPT